MCHQYLHDTSNDDVIVTSLKRCRFCKKKNARINSASTVASKLAGFKSNWLAYRVWGTLLEKVYKTRMTDLDEFKHRIRTKWAKLDHVVIADAVHHGVAVSQGASRPAAVISSTVFITRQHTDAQYWYSNSVRRPSVCLSVRDVLVSDENGLTYCHSFFHHTVAQSF